MSKTEASTTQMLRDWQAGDAESLDRLFPSLYNELKAVASRHLRNERPNHTLASTALVHEAYLRLSRVSKQWEDRKHFFAVAAIVMRRILVDHAKERHRQKRGGPDQVNLSLDETAILCASPDPRILLVDEALNKLARFDERKAQIIELLFFGGLTFDEVASTLDLSHATLHRDVKFAKSWISHEISPASANQPS